MVVQCPNCQTKFRIADDKVTEKGVRVRCTSCKNVFQVKRSGAEAASQAQSGTTQELQAISFGANGEVIPKGNAKLAPAAGRSMSPPAGGPAPARNSNPPAPRSAPPPLRPDPSNPPPGSQPGANSRRRPTAAAPGSGPALPGDIPPPPARAPRPSADDLFGMDVLTGARSAGPGSPLSSSPNLGVWAKPPPIAQGPQAPLEMDGIPSLANPEEARAPLAELNDGRDPFENVDLNVDSGPTASSHGRELAKTEPPPAPPDPSLQRPLQREMVAVLLTGLLGIALALALAAIAEFTPLNRAWFHEGTARALVATQIASGLYDASAEKPVFFVRGRIENHSRSALGPVHVVAELVAGGGTVAHAEAIAGSEPTPEEVHALRSPEDAEALAKKLARAGEGKKLAPGESLPFFALITDPPADAERDELRLHVEPR